MKVFLLPRLAMASLARRKFIDIGANLTDPVYRGLYHGKQKHADDFLDVAKRAFDGGLTHVVITGGSFSESHKAVKLCEEFSSQTSLRFAATVGCHPTRSNEIVAGKEPKMDYIDGLSKLIAENLKYVAAIGEFGLDYDRLHFADKDVQLLGFESQFQHIVKQFGNGPTALPLFLHCRAAESDFINIVKKYRGDFNHGVVHSFTGTAEECTALLDLDLYIGINGCSLKTEENLQVAQKIPLNRLMIETDCPYCEIRPSHASHRFLSVNKSKTNSPKLCHADKWQPGCLVRGRNEPCKISDVFEVLCALRCSKDGISEDDLADTIHANTLTVFSSLSA